MQELRQWTPRRLSKCYMDPSGKGIKMNKQTLRIIISVIIGTLLFVFSFGLWIVSLFSGSTTFFTISILSIDLLIIGLLISWVKSSLRLFIIFIALLLLVFGCVSIKLLFDKHDNSIPVFHESKVVINDYLPFSHTSKIAKLQKNATVSISNNLPVIDGATALYPLYSSFVNAIYPENTYDPNDSVVLCSTTSKAYENLLNGKVDVIFCAEPSKEQISIAASKGVKLILTPIGKEAFVFFVNKENNVDNISSKDIIGIYSGKIKNWKDIGGKNSPIKVFQRPENSGSQTVLQKIMRDEEIVPPLKNEVIDGMGGIIEKTADYKNYKNAIGYSFLYYSTQMVNNGSIKLLSIDNIKPSKENIINGTYPFVSNFYAITQDIPTDNTQILIKWILSAEGQLLVQQTGYTPIN